MILDIPQNGSIEEKLQCFKELLELKLTQLEEIAGGKTDDNTGGTVDLTEVNNQIAALQSAIGSLQSQITNIQSTTYAMVFKGTIGTGGTVTSLPTTYKVGWTYRVITAGTYAGNACEIGDLIIAIVNRTGSNNASIDWTVAQTNIDGAITNITGTSPISASESGSTVTVSHADSGVDPSAYGGMTGTVSPLFGGNVQIPVTNVDSKGHVTYRGYATLVMPATEASQSIKGLMTVQHVQDLNEVKSRQKVVYFEATLAAGNTVITIGIPTGAKSPYISCVDAVTGEQIIADITYATTSITISISTAYANAISIKGSYIVEV